MELNFNLHYIIILLYLTIYNYNEDDKWKEKVADREKWKGRTAGAVQQSMN